mmetsp:Transcript_17529/g.50920  ORF Transcript_17529/g.50920 Transcript_17529/m.50920 type:complete len:290 (+) Transcript_17529:450-1319(+)
MMRTQRSASNTANMTTGHCMSSQNSLKARITGTATRSAEATHRKHACTTRDERECARRRKVAGDAASTRATGVPSSSPSVSCSGPALPLMIAECKSSHVIVSLGGAPSSSSPPSFGLVVSGACATSGRSMAKLSPNQACTCPARMPGGRDKALCIHSSMCDAEAGSSHCSLPVSARALTASARARITSGFDRTRATSLATSSSPSLTAPSIAAVMGPRRLWRLRRNGEARASSSSTPSSLVASTSNSLDDETSQDTAATKNCVRSAASAFLARLTRLPSNSSVDMEPER